MKDKIASCVREIEPSVIRQMTIRAAQFSDVISLGIGEPDFDTPGDVCESALSDALTGHTHYTPSQGYPELLDALTNYIKRGTGIELTRDHVLVTHGGMGGISGFLSVVNSMSRSTAVEEVDRAYWKGRRFPVSSSLFLHHSTLSFMSRAPRCRLSSERVV